MQVPEYWKRYAAEVDTEREMWLNSFYRAPLRLPMPAELEHWWQKGGLYKNLISEALFLYYQKNSRLLFLERAAQKFHFYCVAKIQNFCQYENLA